MSYVAVAVGGAALVGGVIAGSASQNAANTEAGAANAATGAQEQMFGTEQQNEQPYIQAGDQALSQIQGNMGAWNQPFTMNDFENQSPEYGFDLSQGLAGEQSAEAAQGAEYGTGTISAMNNYAQNMALNSYNSAFQNYQTQIQNSYSRLAGVAQIGQSAAAGINSNATAVGGNIGNNIVGAGNASAAGQVGTANAVTGAIGTGANGALMASILGGGNGQTSQAISGAFNNPNTPQLSMPQMGAQEGYPAGGGSTLSSLY